MLRLSGIIFVLMLSLFSMSATASSAEALSGSSVILSIDVEGNNYVEKEAALSKMGIKTGAMLDRRQLSRDVRALYKTGFFSTVRFTGTRTPDGIKLVCHVKEYPLIAKLSFDGNEEFGEKDLRVKMKMKPGRIFSPTNQSSDRNTIRKGYLKDGYYQVDVKFIATPTDDGRVNVVAEIQEGEVTYIKRIRFVGNNAFSDQRLRDEILSRQSDFQTWISDKDVFDQKRFGVDGQLLQQFYLNNGYLDIQLESTQINMTQDKKAFNLAFNVHEGDQYQVSSVDLQGDLVPDEESLLELVKVAAGETYAHADMGATIEALTERVGDEGYAFATVTPLMNRNVDDHTVSISFDIEKGEEVYIERVEISGNEKTEDAVIRRLLKQSEGARYAGGQVKLSKEGVRRSSFVEDVRVSFPKGSSSDKALMKMDIKEKNTGTLSGGVGYSQTEKVTFTAKVTEENLFGKGYRASLNGEYGKITQNITASLSDPYFLFDNVSGSINFFNTQTDPLTTTTYQTASFGGGFGIGVPITDYFSYGINYQYNETNLQIVNQAIGTSLFVQAQQGKQTTGELSQTLTWDNRDSMLSTSEGHMERLGFGVAGLGGDNRFYEASFQSKSYFSFGDKHDITLNPSFGASMMRGYSNKEIPLYRRYSLGGIGSLRGFDSIGVSLRDPVTGEAVGGDKQLMASLNLFFPLPYMETKGFRGVVFVDSGIIWGSVTSTVGAVTVNVAEPFTLSKVRYSAGLGFEWLSPIGPVGLAWSIPIRKVAGDIEKSIEFVLGTSF